MRLFAWLIFSIPTTLAYTYEALGLFKVAVFLYRRIIRFSYPPALYNLGQLYVTGDGVVINVDVGKMYIEKAANLGYRSASEWLERYGSLTQKSFEDTAELRLLLNNHMNGSTPAFFHFWNKVKPYFWLAWHILVVCVIVMSL